MDKHKDKLTASKQQLAQQLKVSEQQFQSLVETSSDWIWQIDLEGKYTYSNCVGEAKLGYLADTLIEMDPTELVHPEDRQVFGEIYKKAIRTKAGWDSVVLRWRGKDGEYRYFESSARPKLGPDGELIGFIGVDRDITERKQAEEKLRTKERVFDTSLSAISIADPEGIINEANTAFLQVWGFSNKDEVLGRKISYFLQSEEKATEIVETLNKAGVWEGDFIAKKKDGSTFIAHSFATVLHDNNGEIVGYQSSVRDITERKQAEEEREKLLKILISKNKEMQSIVYIASHDLRSPLVNVTGFGDELARDCNKLKELLQDAAFDEDNAKIVNSIIDESIPESLYFITASAKKMHMLLDGLLQVSRIGSAEINIGRLDMNKIISHVVETSQFKAKECGATISVDQLGNCFGDGVMINQVFSNLIDNALKYLDKKRKGKIHISCRTEDQMNIYCIEDNGIGIDPEHQSKIFEIFHRLEPEDSAGGEGIGLTIVTRILDRQDGRIWVESERGKGSRFYVSLPAG